MNFAARNVKISLMSTNQGKRKEGANRGDFRRKHYLALTFNLRYNDLRAGAFHAISPSSDDTTSPENSSV